MIGTILQAAALAKVGGAIGAGIVAIGAGFGIGKLAQSTMEASARQPEIAGGLRTTAIIIGALLEGICLIGVIACLLAVLLS
ncbi:MAG: ATP synthase F0 subunit C [Oscillospiraceae bacterium]|jgi:F-type H+-transporting ATPase subunit c|nr:ATP synthase F0 subunit C [Oscillospiraceae bacterium]